MKRESRGVRSGDLNNSQIVVRYLNKTYGAKWIGTRGPILWPPRSPDLTPHDFFLRMKKDMVHSHPITNLEELQQRIQQEISKITERDIRNVLRNVKKWMKKCLDCNGEPF